jgi:fructose/tagatose bisphosphate aldolase
MLPSPEQYAAMRDSAGAGCYALPAINVTSSQTLNAAMCGFAELRGQRALFGGRGRLRQRPALFDNPL